MSKSNRKIAFFAVASFIFIICFASFAKAEDSESKKQKALRKMGKVSVVVVKTTAKFTYETLKLVGKRLVVPAAKASSPAIKAATKLTGKGIVNGAKGVAKLVRRISDENSDDGKIVSPGNQNKADN